MNLDKLKQRVNGGAGSRQTIDDRPLLDWAEEEGIAAGQAQLEALRNGIVPTRYLKNFRALELPEQIRICEGRVLICGCGGLGGCLVNLLARVGAGLLRVLDCDEFAPSNLNRQWLCDVKRISRNKAEVAAARIQAVNPFVLTEAFVEALNEKNTDRMVAGMDLVLDALDNLEGRFLLAGAARRARIPFVHAAATGWWGQVSTFLPDSPYDLAQIYGTRKSRDPAEDQEGVLGPTAAVIGSLEALEAIRILAGKKPSYAGRLLYFDGETGRTEILPL